MPLATRAVNLYRNNRLLTCTCQGRSIIGFNYAKPVKHNAYAFTKVGKCKSIKEVHCKVNVTIQNVHAYIYSQEKMSNDIISQGTSINGIQNNGKLLVKHKVTYELCLLGNNRSIFKY